MAKTVKYGLESARYYFRYPHDLQDFIGQDDYSDKLLPGKVLSIAGSAVMGAVVIDLANDSGLNLSSKTREQATFRAGAVLHYADILDDLIDKHSLPPYEKAQAIKAVIAGDFSQLPNDTSDKELERLLVMASHIGNLIHEHPLLEDIFMSRYPALESALGGFSSIEEAEAYIDEIGALVGECSVYAAESAAQTDLPENVKQAAISAGRYAMYLDHAYEMADDITEGTRSLATALRSQHSTRETRRYCRQAASAITIGAMQTLNPVQRSRLAGVNNLLLYRSLAIKWPIDTYKLIRT